MITFKDVTDKLTKIYEEKNHFYGDSFEKTYAQFGLVSAVVRINDKVNRLNSLTALGGISIPREESIDDTLLDLANYAILTYLIRNKNNDLPC